VATVVGATVLSSAGLALATLQVANASTLSPFDPPAPVTTDGNGATEGTISLYDADGNKITSGALTAPPVYAKADTDPGRTGDNVATLYAYTPKEGVNPLSWSGQGISVSATYPTSSTSVPANLRDQPQALTGATGTGLSIFNWFAADGYPADFPNTNTTPAWQNLYQLRMFTTGPGQPLLVTRYSSATILVSGDTWTQVFPEPGGAAPEVTTAAAITGTPKVGLTLTCSATFTGADSTSYAWFSNDVSIGVTASTYKPVAGDVGKAVKCTATGTNTSGSTPSTSPTVTVGLGAPLKNTSKPVVKGKPKVGKTLTCAPGSWTPAATSLKYQWLRNGDNIRKATSQKYKVIRKDAGKRLACTVTALKAGYANGKATSAAVRIKR
jgi:hypothetical protein